MQRPGGAHPLSHTVSSDHLMKWAGRTAVMCRLPFVFREASANWFAWIGSWLVWTAGDDRKELWVELHRKRKRKRREVRRRGRRDVRGWRAKSFRCVFVPRGLFLWREDGAPRTFIVIADHAPHRSGLQTPTKHEGQKAYTHLLGCSL